MFIGDYVIHTAGVVSLEIIVTADTATDRADDVDTATLSGRVTRTSQLTLHCYVTNIISISTRIIRFSRYISPIFMYSDHKPLVTSVLSSNSSRMFPGSNRNKILQVENTYTCRCSDVASICCEEGQSWT